jgi:RNA polymerase sigma factor (sigma-70 family)
VAPFPQAHGDEPLARAFRDHYRRVVTRLAREFGFHLTEGVEDAVQGAMVAALRAWPRSGTPVHVEAWLTQVARRRLLDELRRSERRNLSLDEAWHPDGSPGDGESDPGGGAWHGEPAAMAPAVHMAAEVADDELRMLFVCADETIPLPSQLVLALKILGGFSTREIALRLMTSEDNVQKRLSRGRERLRQLGPAWEPPSLQALQSRRDAVLRIVYLLFNEGYSSAVADQLIRRELCDEAMRLARVMAAHPACAAPEVDALLALMLLHSARFDARLGPGGALLLLQAQDRERWDRATIADGLQCLVRSGRGAHFSRYHAEAAVAAVHCAAPSYAQTDWAEIVTLYKMLERIEPSPLYVLNRAIALAEWQGPEAGLAVLHALQPPGWLARYYLWDATLGELERRAGRFAVAATHLERALAQAPHPAERELIQTRLAACARGDSGAP